MISQDSGRRVFCLEIGGLKYRYFSCVPPASSNLNTEITSGIDYVNSQSIVSIGSFQSSIDPAGGLASYSPVSIELSIKRDSTPSDPGIIFSRVGKRSAALQSNLTQNITFNSLPQTINLDNDLSSLSTPALVHVGAETFKISAFTSSSMTISARAVGNTQYQSHEISLQGSSVPIVSSEITIFRGRRAKIYIAHQDQSGNIGDFTEIINGFIESSPYVENGTSINLSILPLVSLIDGKLADTKNGVSLLLQNFHHFSDKSNVFEYGSSFGDYNMILHGATQYPTPGLPSTQTKINVIFPIDINLNDVFDVTRDNGEGFVYPHPRFPLLIVGYIYRCFPVSLGITGNTPFIIIDHTINSSIDQNTLITLFSNAVNNQVLAKIPKRGEIKRYVLARNSLQRWPEIINETLDSFGASSHTGTAGAFHALRIDPINNEIIGIPLSDQRGWSPGHDGKIHLWYSSAWYESSPRYHYANWSNDNTENLSRFSNERRIFYPLDFWNDGTKPNFAGSSRKVKSLEFPNRRSVSIRDQINIALAYHQANERTILVEHSLNLPSAATVGVFYGIQVETYDYFEKRSKVLYYQASHQTQVSFNSVNVGYLIHLPNIRENQNNGHFGDWRGEDRTKVTRGISENRISPGEIMLSILQSGGGGNNGDYDTLGVGLSIHENHIDIDSFLRNGTTNQIALNTTFSVDDFDAREFMDSLLKSLCCIITMKRKSGGPSKITLESLGTETKNHASLTLNNNELLATPAPYFSIYEDIITQVNIEYGWNNDENKFQDKVTFNDQDSINRYGGEKSSIDLSLYGLSPIDVGFGSGDVYNYLLPLASRVFNTMSNPVIKWIAEIGTGKSIYLDVGTYVQCTSPHFKSYNDSFGVIDKVGMIQSINQELMGEGCKLEIIHTGISVTNWNSTLKVTFINSASEITVSNNTYSENDLSFFAIGDFVDFLPFGDEDNGILSLKILNINGTMIQFTTNHNISTLGTLEPSAYNIASDDHKLDAYLSNNNVLGTSDKPKEYA